jgi:hypothetical protein
MKRTQKAGLSPTGTTVVMVLLQPSNSIGGRCPSLTPCSKFAGAVRFPSTTIARTLFLEGICVCTSVQCPV